MKNNLHLKNKKTRIISGKWKGRKIPLPINTLTLRPTKNKIRETLFNWLQPIIYNATCLDCFAGSGILGIEAVSRGASKAFLLEKNKKTQKHITTILKTLKTKQIIPIFSNTLHWLNTTKKKFDIIFIDPPFQKHTVLCKTIQLLENNHIPSTNSWIYIETSIYSPAILIPKSWKQYRKKKSGNVLYQIYKKIQ
ncbi:MAG: 16S rRNA m(2)G966 methyltransferase [Candidatus Westeberhardia cardiocondylae]|nr:16S rRNA m(2)G966 methyltransferase [Candidatus Westeberhardia cardiocondylae]